MAEPSRPFGAFGTSVLTALIGGGSVLVGCGADASSDDPTTIDRSVEVAESVTATTAAPTITTPTSSTSPTSISSPSTSALVDDGEETDRMEAMEISFAVEGGFANLQRSVVIDADGVAAIEVSGLASEFRLDAAEVEAVTEVLDRSGLFDRDRIAEPPTGADQQRYEIGYRGVVVVVHDSEVPAELADAIELLEAIIRRP